jgi:hypothetical protein
LHGEARAGATLNFGKAEVYWPQDDESSKKYEKLVGIETRKEIPPPGKVEPTFEAGVQLDAQLDVIVTPEVLIPINSLICIARRLTY